ncbi:MAG: 30S ribosomal protein S16 [Candidatus Curtissbacteria bacterium GW2011_GWA1_40_47]|uniref:Small ribosomal subunit protein bS16 n=1 Tax=Candidatus Curtissbacteria bacterium RIFOXYA1_FULL_41_14 TaxID=1797737 RepID=A0A1F5HGL4_9BACT|nr:MAG: 30S ribosomal protein S16 [Candidatus Curtissbacteria bacterium GW2011_GWB1_40_28]KKR61130.1 MAG: 30S ribosomal protein S16 [Candidatus Curtissbacteria bacterium GW2011_GWA2_40_31]KKR61910.1 MAG: 30S ribosomal protein S16 [Microgenomates group bacterium GW2011_GWC1_40_35]KKR65987.1 MAG: 30S ribosomal protein S16 [Candidatus Curtissbacteria bacterium GW2011_GWA1_40_47]KKS02182.1 MAG: 30S ribosomal protein S16 [Candidatus Curtissbacteria bacterium GW2011_GWC2_41_21]OGD78753.1 MAG: 30S ri
MSVRIRLSKVGKKHQVSYRIVAQDSRSKRDGQFLENIGFYNPQNTTDNIKLKIERFDFWIKKGAKPTQAVAKLLERALNAKEPIKTTNK